MLTGELLQPLVTAVTENIKVIVPIGLTIMGAVIGVGLIPRIVYKFI